MSLFIVAQTLSDDLSQYSVRVLLGGIVAVLIVLVFASGIHHRYHFTKKAFYTLLSCIILATTTALLVINLKLITSSEDGAISRLDGKMSIFACGQEISVIPNSTLFSQSSGDSRHRVFPNGDIEFMGYRTAYETDGSLGAFFRAIGGSISANVVALPYNDATEQNIANNSALSKFVKTNPMGEKYLELRSGESCGETPSMTNVFIYEHNSTLHDFTQRRIVQTPEQYTLSNKPFSEPDCIVVIFGKPVDKTDLTCRGYPDPSKIRIDLLEGVNE